MTQFFAAFEDLFKSIYELFASIIGAFAHAIQAVISTVLNFFSGIINLFTDVFKGVVDVVGGVGSFVISKSSTLGLNSLYLVEQPANRTQAILWLSAFSLPDTSFILASSKASPPYQRKKPTRSLSLAHQRLLWTRITDSKHWQGYRAERARWNFEIHWIELDCTEPVIYRSIV